MIYKLCDVADFNLSNLSKNDSIEYIKYLDTSSIIENEISSFQILNSKIDKIPSRCKRKVKDKTIVYSTVRPKLHHYGILDNPKQNVIVSTGFVTIDAKRDIVDPYYLYYFLVNNKNTIHLSQIAETSVSAYPSIVPEDIKNLEIDLAIDLNKQKEIGKKLHNLDLKIKNNNDVINTIIRLCKAEWDLKFNVNNHIDDNCEYNEEIKAKIPCGWVKYKVGDFFDTQAGYAFKSKLWTEKGHPVLTIKSITDGRIDFNNTSFIKQYENNLEKYSVVNGNLIFAMSGNTIGKIGLVATDLNNVLINQRVLIIKTSYETLPFIYMLLNNEYIQEKIYSLGANSAQPNISEDEFKNITLFLPDSEFILQYNYKYNAYFKLISNLYKQNDKLRRMRNSLIDIYFNKKEVD